MSGQTAELFICGVLNFCFDMFLLLSLSVWVVTPCTNQKFLEQCLYVYVELLCFWLPSSVACMQVSLRVNLAGFSILTVSSLMLMALFFIFRQCYGRSKEIQNWGTINLGMCDSFLRKAVV